MSTRLILVRHGRTAWNHAGRFQGQADIGLDEVGLDQAARMAPLVARLAPTALYSSDLLRARQTAAALASVTGLEPRLDPRLQEINVGSWSGKTIAEAAAELPGFHEALAAGRDFRRSETGETATEAGGRVAAVLREVAESRPDAVTAVVGHGLALRVAMLQLLGWDLVTGLALSGLWNCSWTVLERRDRWRLLSYNNTVAAAS